MESSIHICNDVYGYKCSNEINNYDSDIVVFGCDPPLAFDVKAQGLKIKKREYGDYHLVYELREGTLYLTKLEFEPALLFKPRAILGKEPCRPYPNKRRCVYDFGAVAVDYTGVWQIGKDFDFRFWQGDEKIKQTPFCPEVYRVTRIIRTSPRAKIFGAFGLVVLARLIHCVVLRTQNHLKIKTLGSEIFWLTNIRQQQENADDSILIHSRRLTN